MINKLLAGTAMAIVPAVAMAADLPVRSVAPAPVFVAAAPTWGGFYVGANFGVMWSQAENTFDSSYLDGASVVAYGNNYRGTSSSNFGGLAGVTAGYNFQSGMMVFGLEADIGGVFGTKANSHEYYQYETGGDRSTQALGTIRARAGIASGASLFYLTAGVAAVRTKLSVYDLYDNYPGKTGSKSEWKWAGVGGAGIEHQLGGGWSAKVEGLYVFPTTSTIRTFDTNEEYGKSFKAKTSHAIVRFGVNYRFGASASAAPVVARY